MSLVLEQLARMRAQLPTFGAPGASMVEQLIAAEAEARSRLLKYTAIVQYDAGLADQVVHTVGGWAEANEPALAALMANPAIDTLPEAVALEFGAEQAGQFVIAAYSNAVRTLGAWTGGGVLEALQQGGLFGISAPWAAQDAVARLTVFATIVKLDDEDALKDMLQPPAAVQGLGTWQWLQQAGVKGAIFLITIVIGLAATIYLLKQSSTLALHNNRVLDENCDWARQMGKEHLVADCIKYSAQGAATIEIPGAKKFARVAMFVGLAYVAVKYGIPALRKRGA